MKTKGTNVFVLSATDVARLQSLLSMFYSTIENLLDNREYTIEQNPDDLGAFIEFKEKCLQLKGFSLEELF